jgi:hypothetical protein
MEWEFELRRMIGFEGDEGVVRHPEGTIYVRGRAGCRAGLDHCRQATQPNGTLLVFGWAGVSCIENMRDERSILQDQVCVGEVVGPSRAQPWSQAYTKLIGHTSTLIVVPLSLVWVYSFGFLHLSAVFER